MRLAFLLSLALSVPLRAQAPAVAGPPPAPLPPATKLEAFKPAAGTVVTLAFTDVSDLREVEVDAREMRGATGSLVRGLLVRVTQSQYRAEQSFVDVEEIPELIKGIDHLLGVTTNPSPAFKDFEVRYTTKGGLECTVFSYNGSLRYSIRAGRTLTATRLAGTDDMRKFREIIVAAQTALAGAAK